LTLINIRHIAEHITLGILNIEEFVKDSAHINKREMERSATGILLKKLYDNASPELCYNAEGKPFFNDIDDHISISHSHGRLCVIINKRESCGVDIELIRDKVLNIKHKFLSADELYFAREDIIKLTTLWAAKESIYKAYGLKGLDFIRHMKIENFEEDQSEFFGYLQKDSIQKKYLLKRDQLDNYALVYTLDEIR
jgi:4'-phosphopantetheinyl transferase